MTRIALLCLVVLLGNVVSLKFLVYNPRFGRSHVTFMGKVAEVLVDAGHEVVMLSPTIQAKLNSLGTDKVKRIITVPQTEEAKDFEETVQDKMSANLWTATSFLSAMKEFGKFSSSIASQCNATIMLPGLLESLKNEKFDAAMAEPMDMCGFGIFYRVGIENIAVTLSVGSFEGSFAYTGLPSFPSYVPGMMSSSGEKMSFFERMSNLLGMSMGRIMFPMMALPTEEVFKQHYGQEFPSLKDIVALSSLHFINAEPLIEFPRVILHKTIDIGGISVSTGHSDLNKTWSDILDLRSKTVLISFGTVAKSHLMPEEYKQSIRQTARTFPDVTFIWKYEQPGDKMSEGITNLIESTWIPQNDMLYDRRLSLFITHGGQGSITEATTAGVPLIVIPVLGDQIRNAAVIKRIGTGFVLEKTMMSDCEKLSEAVEEILSNDEYTKKARFVGNMISDRPFTAKETFVRNVEFMAKYGPLRQLDHYGKELNFFQYYLIDVFTFLTSIVLFVLFVVYKALSFIIRKCFGIGKVKKD